MTLSIIICTFNPRIDYLVSCLNAIKKAKENLNLEIEIILVNNNSNNNFLSNSKIGQLIIELGVKVTVEKKQGLTHARIRGIQESKGEYIVFIDDDNVIDPNFLKFGVEIANEFPFVGAFSGNVQLVLEENPRPGLENYLGLLVQRELYKDEWSNLYFNNKTMPCGAGLWVSKNVANYYTKLNRSDRSELISDRVGDDLSSGGDNDLAMCAIDIGLGMGLFERLRVYHLIPKNRVNESYLLKLNEGIEYSSTLLRYVRTGEIEKINFKSRVANLLRMLMRNRIDRRFFSTTLNGRKRALRLILRKK